MVLVAMAALLAAISSQLAAWSASGCSKSPRYEATSVSISDRALSGPSCAVSASSVLTTLPMVSSAAARTFRRHTALVISSAYFLIEVWFAVGAVVVVMASSGKSRRGGARADQVRGVAMLAYFRLVAV